MYPIDHIIQLAKFEKLGRRARKFRETTFRFFDFRSSFLRTSSNRTSTYSLNTGFHWGSHLKVPRLGEWSVDGGRVTGEAE